MPRRLHGSEQLHLLNAARHGLFSFLQSAGEQDSLQANVSALMKYPVNSAKSSPSEKFAAICFSIKTVLLYTERNVLLRMLLLSRLRGGADISSARPVAVRHAGDLSTLHGSSVQFLFRSVVFSSLACQNT